MTVVCTGARAGRHAAVARGLAVHSSVRCVLVRGGRGAVAVCGDALPGAAHLC